MKNIISYFIKRNVIFQITKKKELIKNINHKFIKLYCGFDPTSDSLHIGHLILIIFIIKFIEYKYKIIIVIGGTTSLIGDPSFKEKKNIKIYNKNNINIWSNSIKKQIKKIFNYKKLLILNNKNWLNKIKLINFLENIGKNIKVNYILNKEFIKFKIKNNIKLSFKEFSYNLLQSYDFLYLNNKYNINLQIGGSDQWGNITSGIKLIKNINKKTVYGITLPLLIKQDGTKFSKSDNKKDTIWLNKNKTSVYKFYQFWININDNYVKKYLEYFTNIHIKNINYIYNKGYKGLILGKKIIAKKLTKIVHGTKELNKILKITKILFTKKIQSFKKKDFCELHKYKFNIIKLNNNEFLNKILVINKIFNSKNKANKHIIQGSIKLNGKIINNIKYNVSKKDVLYKKYILLTKCKKKFYLIIYN